MIRSPEHPKTRKEHRARRRHVRHTWFIVAAILAITAVLVLLGYFAGVSWHTLGTALFQSVYRLAAGYLLALLLGAGIALIVGWSPFSNTLFPVFDVMQNVPSFALIPLFVVWLGYTDTMIIVFSATSIMWPILFAVLTAIRSAHTDWNDAATIFGARGIKRIYTYLLPLSYPAIITGSIVGIAIGWEAVIGAEIIGNAGGIGAYISGAGAGGVTPALAAGLIGVLVVVFVVNRLLWSPLLSESAHHYAE